MTRVGDMRWAVIQRDGYCVAALIDRDSGPCHDMWGKQGPVLIGELEVDYVRRGARAGRHELAEDHVALCPGHHRGTGAQGGQVWATAHRAELRAYLRSQQNAGGRDG